MQVAQWLSMHVYVGDDPYMLTITSGFCELTITSGFCELKQDFPLQDGRRDAAVIQVLACSGGGRIGGRIGDRIGYPGFGATR